MKAKAVPAADRSAAQVAGISVLISLFSFLYYFQHGDLLLYGDAVAHINIARRVFDSLTPGPLQLGTVWLPLPHLLMVPFLWSNAMWQSGAGGSIPSMIAFVFGVMGIFRLVRGVLEAAPRTKPVAAMGGWIAAFAYGANPNLIYMQATAMTEPLYLALYIWAFVYFAEFVRSLPNDETAGLTPASRSALTRCGLCLAGTELTRYDGWFLAGFIGSAIVIIALRRGKNRDLRRHAIKFLLGIAVAPGLWLAYTAIVAFAVHAIRLFLVDRRLSLRIDNPSNGKARA